MFLQTTNLADLDRNRADFDFGRSRAELGPNSADLQRSRPIHPKFCPCHAKFGLFWPIPPEVATDIGRIRPELGRHRPHFSRFRAEFGPHWPIPARSRPNSGRSGADPGSVQGGSVLEPCDNLEVVARAVSSVRPMALPFCGYAAHRGIASAPSPDSPFSRWRSLGLEPGVGAGSRSRRIRAPIMVQAEQRATVAVAASSPARSGKLHDDVAARRSSHVGQAPQLGWLAAVAEGLQRHLRRIRRRLRRGFAHRCSRPW